MEFVELQRPAHVMQAPLEPETIARLCKELLDDEPVAVQPLQGGNFNTLYRIQLRSGPQVVLRAAPGDYAPLLRHEQTLLRRQCHIQTRLEPLGEVVPALLTHDFSRRHVDRDVAFFSYAGGMRWDLLAPRLGPDQQASLWQQYGVLVARLHALPGTDFGFVLAPQASYSEHMVSLLLSLQADLQDRGVDSDSTRQFVRLVCEQIERFDAVRQPRLVHGDLWQRNVLIGEGPEGPRISALLDAERAFWGEPAAEWIFGFLEIPAAFWRGYGKNLSTDALKGEALWRRRVYQGRGALQLILDAQRFGFDGGFARRQLMQCLELLKPSAGKRPPTSLQACQGVFV